METKVSSKKLGAGNLLTFLLMYPGDLLRIFDHNVKNPALNAERTFSIVMADDDLDDQYLVKRAIEDTDIRHALTIVNNGRQLLDLLQGRFVEGSQKQSPDCILLDLNMPLLDGFEALGRIKADPGLRHIPVFVLSTSHSETDRTKSLQLGASAFYVKPAKYRELMDIIGEICVRTMIPDPRPSIYN